MAYSTDKDMCLCGMQRHIRSVQDETNDASRTTIKISVKLGTRGDAAARR